MQYIRDFFAALWRELRLFHPVHMVCIVRRGVEEVDAFRATHGREPNEKEWAEIYRRVNER